MNSLRNPRLFRALVWLPMRAHAGRTLLAMIAIALGVSLGLAIFLMTRAATTESARASRSLFGEVQYMVQGAGDGFDESLYPKIARTTGVINVMPVIEVRGRVIGRDASLTIIGRDLLRGASQENTPPRRDRSGLNALDPSLIFLSSAAANSFSVKVGDELAIQVGVERVAYKVAAVVPFSSQNAAFVDIASAQWRLGRIGKLSRIEFDIEDGADTAAVVAAIEMLLPNDAKLTAPENESNQAAQLTRPITINLLGVALVALFTGMFLVYSTQSLAIRRRRREFAVLHALGVTPKQQMNSVLLTGFAVGLGGAILGLGLGVVLAKFGLQTVPGMRAPLVIAGWEMIFFACLGIATSVIGSVAPALSVAGIPTAQALKAGDIDEHSSRGHVAVAAALWIIAIPLLLAPPIFDLPLFGYLAVAFLLFGSVLLIPLFTRHALRAFPTRRVVTYQTALAQLRGVAHTATNSVATMLVSVSLMVAMSIMGASLRGSMSEWAEKMFPADLLVQMNAALSHLDENTVLEIEAAPGIARVERMRVTTVLLDKSKPAITLVARNADSLLIEEEIKQTQANSLTPIWINRVLADRDSLSVGDQVRFELGGQSVVAVVQGVWRDYFNANGAFVIEYPRYLALTADKRISGLSIWLDSGISAAAAMEVVRKSIHTDAEVNITLPGESRARLLRGFDALFGIIYLLLVVAVAIGLLGIGVNASAQVLARRAEFGVLRHLGFTRKQIGTVLSIEGFCLGLLGSTAGLLLGSIIGAIMIYVVTPQSFHWSMDLHVPIAVLLGLAVSIPCASGLVAFISGRGAMNDDVVRAVKEDW